MSVSNKKSYLAIQVFILMIFLVSQISTSCLATTNQNNFFRTTDSTSNAIIWETIHFPDYMDPHKNYEFAGARIHYNIYETLFTYPWDTPDTSPSEPLLAESVIISSDGLTYTFILRHNIKFHDGTEFNATAVQMNFWRMLGRGWDDGWGPVWMIAEPILGGQAIENAVFEYGDGSPEHIAAWENWVENVSAVVVNSEFEVEVHLAYPFTPFLVILANEVGGMISPEFFMNHGGMSPESTDLTLDTETCGTGPYMLVHWTIGDEIELTLNPNYWRADAAKISHPNAGAITDVTIKNTPDLNNRILHLLAGTTDACYWPTTHAYLIWNNVTTIGDGTLQSINPEIKVWAGNPTYDIMFLGFNMNPYLNISNNIFENPFHDWELRMAISYAYDYGNLISNNRNGFGWPLKGPIPQGMFAHYSGSFMFEQNMNEAITHWNLAIANGLNDVLANNSYNLFIYYNEGNTDRERAGLLVKEAIENIIADPTSTDPSAPIIIDVIAIEWASYLYMRSNNQISIFFENKGANYADPNDYAAPIVKTTGTYASRIGLAGSVGEGGLTWDGASVDGWIDEAASETNAATRINLYRNIQEAIVDHCAYIWGYQATNFHVEGAWMNGYVFNPMHDPYFYHYYLTDMTTTTSTDISTDTTTNDTTGPYDGEFQPLILAISIGSGLIILIVIVLIFRSRK